MRSSNFENDYAPLSSRIRTPSSNMPNKTSHIQHARSLHFSFMIATYIYERLKLLVQQEIEKLKQDASREMQRLRELERLLSRESHHFTEPKNALQENLDTLKLQHMLYSDFYAQICNHSLPYVSCYVSCSSYLFWKDTDISRSMLCGLFGVRSVSISARTQMYHLFSILLHIFYYISHISKLFTIPFLEERQQAKGECWHPLPYFQKCSRLCWMPSILFCARKEAKSMQ